MCTHCRNTIFALIVAGLLAGCESAPSNKISRERIQRNNKLLGELAQNEEQHGKMLSRDVAMIEGEYKDDVASTRRDFAVLDHLMDQEFKEWAKRQPMYERVIGKWLAGKPEHIEPTFNEIVN